MNSIFHRISVRKYKDTPVEQEKIEQMIWDLEQSEWGFFRMRPE